MEVIYCQLFHNFMELLYKCFFKEEGQHHQKHIHIKYNEYKAVYNLEGTILEGKLPNKQQKLVEAWIFIHQEELQTLWDLIQEQGEYFKIDPLK